MVVEDVDVEVEEVAGEVGPVVTVARFLEVLAALLDFSSGMTTIFHMRKAALGRLRRIPVGGGGGAAVGVAVVAAADFEQLDLANHLSSALDQFQRQTYWAALAC